MVHVCDLARLVRQASFPLIDSADAEVTCPYFLAVDLPPAPPPPPGELEDKEDAKVQEGGKKLVNQSERDGGTPALTSPRSGSRPDTAGEPAEDAEEGE